MKSNMPPIGIGLASITGAGLPQQKQQPASLPSESQHPAMQQPARQHPAGGRIGLALQKTWASQNSGRRPAPRRPATMSADEIATARMFGGTRLEEANRNVAEHPDLGEQADQLLQKELEMFAGFKAPGFH